jgi:hypothetical protein
VAGQDKPKNTREKKEDKRGLQGDRAVETEEAAYAKSEADRKEWCARGEHLAQESNGITKLSQMNGIPSKFQ